MHSIRRPTSMLLGAALLIAAVTPGALAQGPSGSPATPQTCGVLTADEVSAALGQTLTVVSGDPTDCEFDADYAAGNYLSLYTSVQSGDLDTMRTLMCMAVASSASPAPCGVDLQVAEAQALYLPDSMGTLLYVALSPDNLFNIQLIGDPADGVDKQAAVTGLAEKAMGRLASMPLPTPEPAASQQALEGAPDLEALVPAQIGGVDVTIQSMSSNDLNQSGQVPAEFTAALSSIGKTMDDVSLAYAYVGSTPETYATITAFQVRGADMSALQATLLPILYTDQTIDPGTATQVAGKNVTSTSISGTLTYLYPHNDILWVVTAVDPSLTEIFQKLP